MLGVNSIKCRFPLHGTTSARKKIHYVHYAMRVTVQGRGVMGDMWVCGHIVRRVAASPLCFADFEVRRRKRGREGVRLCGGIGR